MPLDTAASAAGTVAQPSVAAPATSAPAPAPTASPETATQSSPSTPFKTAQEFIDSSPESLATRYGIDAEQLYATAPDEGAEGPEASAPIDPAPSAPAPEQTSETQTPVATPEPAPAFEPVTKFSMYDDEGEFEIPQHVKIGFNAGGKEFKDLRIDEVVRMAQQAPNIEHQRALDRAQHQQQVMQLAQREQALQQEIANNNAVYEQLLANPGLYQEAAARYQALNTPDARAARLEQEFAQRQQQLTQQSQAFELQQISQAAATYTATRLAPSVEALVTQYESGPTPALESGDVMAKFHELTAPLLAPSPTGGTWVPPHRLADIETSVLPALATWAQQRAAKAQARYAAANAAATAATQQAQAQTRKAQQDAQAAARQLTRPLTPAGTMPRPDTPRERPIKSATDAVDAIVDRAARQIRGAA